MRRVPDLPEAASPRFSPQLLPERFPKSTSLADGSSAETAACKLDHHCHAPSSGPIVRAMPLPSRPRLISMVTPPPRSNRPARLLLFWLSAASATATPSSLGHAHQPRPGPLLGHAPVLPSGSAPPAPQNPLPSRLRGGTGSQEFDVAWATSSTWL